MHKSTISRELRRNKGIRDARTQAIITSKQFSADGWNEVERLIRDDLSPEQTANRLWLEGMMQISHECIYQRSCGQPDGGGQELSGILENRVSINGRPEIAGQKMCI